MKKFSVIISIFITMLLYCVSVYAQGIFTNAEYDYSIAIPDSVSIITNQELSNKNSATNTFTHDKGDFSVIMGCERIDGDTISKMRKYIDDYLSTDDEIFEKLLKFKDSYFDALLGRYRRDFLFENTEDISRHSNAKVFSRYTEKISGINSQVILYNTLKASAGSYEEVTHLDISIPVAAKRTIYSLGFTIKKGHLREEVLDKIAEMVTSVKISNLPKQENPLKVFSAKSSIKAANLGIYPSLINAEIEYVEYINKKAGYKISYPQSFIPDKENSLIDSMDYKSFKINLNHSFNITVEPVSNGLLAIENKINLLENSEKDDIIVTSKGVRQNKDKEYYYVKYSTNAGSSHIAYNEDYYIINNGKLYKIQLNSRFIRPSFAIQSEFMNIIYSLEFLSQENEITTLNLTAEKYINNEEGYSFSYPQGWVMDQNASNDINYDIITVTNAGYSGPLEIYISEGELKSPLSTDDLNELVTSKVASVQKKYFKKYTPPFTGRPVASLTGSYTTSDGVTYIKRLLNYVDSNERIRLCYVVDIIRDKKVVSMFITVSEYITSTGRITNNELESAVNLMAGSFDIEKTPEYLERQGLGESRNKKVVLLEYQFKTLFGEQATVLSATYGSNKNDIIVRVDNIPEKGFYRVKADFTKNEFSFSQALLCSDIIQNAVAQLKVQHSDKLVDEIVTYEKEMSIDIEYRQDEHSPSLRETYVVKTAIHDDKMVWDLVMIK
mgnify:CR=1 FL=1